MVTTIKIREEVKSELDGLRIENESYEAIIKRMISEIKKKRLSKDLKEGYLALSKKQFQEFKEWDSI